MEPDQQPKRAERDNNNHNEGAKPTQKDSETKKECDNDVKNDSEEIKKEEKDIEKVLPVNNIIKSKVDRIESSKSEGPQSSQTKSTLETISSSSKSEDVTQEPIKQTEVPLKSTQSSTNLQTNAVEKSEIEDKSNNSRNENIDSVDGDKTKKNDECAENRNTVVVAAASNEVVEKESSMNVTVVKKDDIDEEPNSLPSFPGTITKSVAGSNDVKIEIASSSLFDRVILYSLKNKVIDNSRLDAAKNKYFMNNGQVNASVSSTNSNGSDSNSSSKSVDKLIEEFKGNCKSKTSSKCHQTMAEPQKSDSNNVSNGAENKKLSPVTSLEQVDVKVERIQEISKQVTQSEQKSSENEALDFRDNNSESNKSPSDVAMLDLSVKRDEKCVPPIKRSHALYVGIPDFSKQIFSAPSITRTTNTLSNQASKASNTNNIASTSTIGPPKVRNPDFSVAPRASSELQMRNPDFSKGFTKPSQSPVNVQVTPSNFPEIIRKNNYISDLQLKPPVNTNQPPQQSTVHSSTYKIDYRPPSQSPSYPNLKKESIYNYNNQHPIDEPMAHVIPKNQFNPIVNKELPLGWNDVHRAERLLGGSSHYDQERKISLQEHSNQFNSNEDMRNIHPAHYPYASQSRDERNEFSLKQKEQQLRQEGTIITIKNEAASKTPTNEIPVERRSADLFRDYKLKQPKESPDTVASTSKRTVEPPPLAYHQQYPDFPANYPRHNLSTDSMSIKSDPSPTPMQHDHFPPSAAMRNYHTPSPSSQNMHRQPKSPLTVPPGPSLMHPPQNWVPPPPLVMQTRLTGSPASSSTNMQPSSHHSSTPPNYYAPYPNIRHPSSSRSPSQSPIQNFMHPSFYGTPPQQNLPHQYYKYPESSMSNHRNDMKDSRHNNNYYHNKQPDFSQRFEKDKNFTIQEPHANRIFVPIDGRPPSEGSHQQRLPMRQDLEIKTIRHPPQEMHHQNMQYRSIDPNAQYYPRNDASKIRTSQEFPQNRDLNTERSRIPPDLKIEKRSDDVKAFPVKRQMPPPDEIPELSIIPQVKSELPQTPVQREIPTTSNVIKSTKSLFAEVKRESPLDLSVKTVKTKADSTGCDSDFPSRHRVKPTSLKIEFSPKFENAPKTDCRQQARLGPQEYPVERTIHVGIERPPMRMPQIDQTDHQPAPSNRPLAMYPARSQPNQQASLMMPPNHKAHPYPQKYPIRSDTERPHAPVPTVSEYYNNNQKQIPPQQMTQRPHLAGPSSSQRYESNFHNEASRGFSATPQSTQYPVINKPSHAGNSMNAKSNLSINPKDPVYLEKERDRKYVEEILRRSRNVPEQQQQQQGRPYPSPPRKRHLETAQHMYSSVPQKHSKIEESKPFVDARFSHSYIDPRKIGTPPTLVRHEKFPQAPMSSNNNASKQYPDPRKDAIKSAEMAYSSSSNSSFYPNPKAEMIYRSDPNAMNKFYFKEAYQQNQNFQHRPDDGIFPINSRVAPHPLSQPENNAIKVEQQQTTGPMSELQQLSGEKPLNNGLLLPPALSGSNGNIPRGAEQSTIQKLKSNLQLKGQQKLKIESERHHHHQQQQKIDLSPRQFRTKAEMKGYNPLPVVYDANQANIDLSNPNTSSAPSAFDLLDWGSACNDFVQQLQTGNKKKAVVVVAKKKRSLKSDDKSQTTTIPGTACNDLSQVPKEIVNSINKVEGTTSSDEDKPLLELKRNLSQQDLSDKFSRNFREKQRLEIEQKFAARLGKPSSSESETDTRKGVGASKRVRRLRKRAAVGIKHDDEHSKEEGAHSGDTDDDIQAKRKILKSISKLDDLTSSDEETDKKKKNTSENNSKKEETKKKAVNNSKKPSTSTSDTKQSPSNNAASNKLQSSSDSSESDSTEEELTTEDKINKLSERKNLKKLKDLGDKSNIKNLLEEQKTMTRSKRKLENEKKLSNSKILRNEKVVQNKIVPRGGDKKSHVNQTTCNNKSKSLSPLKRKDSKADDIKRKAHESDSGDGEGNKLKSKKQRKSSKIEEHSSDNNSDGEEEIKAERLRPRKPKIEPTTEVSTKTARKKVESENTPTTSSVPDLKTQGRKLSDLFAHSEDKSSKFAPGWETEAYNFKRSLKIPPGLITIGRPPQHGISHSLPDLDPQTSDTSEIFSEFVKSKDNEGTKYGGKRTLAPKSKAASKLAEKKKPSSIIDLLHHRVMQSKNKFQTKKKVAAISTTSAKSTNESEPLLPTPEKESDKIFGVKKNIFETFILTSRTRTENNSMRKKEILKEVFGADEERPRSAPPSADVVEVEKNISYDQKFREYLEKMNVDFLDIKKPIKCDASVKEEEEDFDDNETIAASEKDLIVPTPLSGKGKMKKNRPRRTKGSSGFDYIRKKKKPTPNANSENPMNVNNIIKKRLAAMESLETKDENDIRKEIKGWVRNKSVGESILHKASRLNYVDVVAYCLDRMGMDPDTKDNAGYTPLHEACSRGHLEIARLLLQFGANHSETALSGIRPLHEAIENGHIEIVRLLLSFGADPCLATYSGQLPIQMAEDKEMEDFLQSYLNDIKEGVKTSWYFECAMKLEDPEEIGYVIFDDVPINKMDLSSSVASVFSTSMTSLITATTQMSDNETVISEATATSTPMKTPMKAPSNDLIKYQHKMKKCDTNSNNLVMSDANNGSVEGKNEKVIKRTKDCSVLLNNIDSSMKKIKKLPAIAKTESPMMMMMLKAPTTEVIHKLSEIKHKEDYDDMMADENVESDCEFLEVEESEAPLPPLYLLKDEGTDKWILLTDLCNLLKVKSKDSVLKQICPTSPPSANKELIREMKMSEFLERATCLQLFCAGEKINVRASKVSLVRYNESVKNILGVQTFKLGMSM